MKDAQAKGYAEADPTGDIEGYDAANKAAIMATLGFHTNVTIDDVFRMATFAAMLGLRIPDIEVINVATTRKTLPDFVGMWSGMLRQ